MQILQNFSLAPLAKKILIIYFINLSFRNAFFWWRYFWEILSENCCHLLAMLAHKSVAITVQLIQLIAIWKIQSKKVVEIQKFLKKQVKKVVENWNFLFWKMWTLRKWSYHIHFTAPLVKRDFFIFRVAYFTFPFKI